jgi:hypothetical protein
MSLEHIIQLQDDITALDELLHEHLNNRELYASSARCLAARAPQLPRAARHSRGPARGASPRVPRNVVDRCLMDNMHDEVFILQTVRELPPEVQADIKKALGNMAARSRHVGLELIRVCRAIER